MGSEITVLETISIKRPNGTGATGLINPTGFGSTATEVATSSLPAETAIVKNIVTDVTTKANLVAAVATLGLDTWFTELKTANDLLDAKYIERTVELGGANPNTIKDKRNDANNVYYALRDMLQGQATVDKGATAVFATTINQINVLIDQYNLILTNRAADAAAKAKKDEKPS